MGNLFTLFPDWHGEILSDFPTEAEVVKVISIGAGIFMENELGKSKLDKKLPKKLQIEMRILNLGRFRPYCA